MFLLQNIPALPAKCKVRVQGEKGKRVESQVRHLPQRPTFFISLDLLGTQQGGLHPDLSSSEMSYYFADLTHFELILGLKMSGSLKRAYNTCADFVHSLLKLYIYLLATGGREDIDF